MRDPAFNHRRRTLALLALILALCSASCRSAALSGGGDSENAQPWELRFEGNESIGDGTLADLVGDLLSEFEDSSITQSALDDAAYSIENHYRSEGWPSAEAGYELATAEDNLALATIRIDEGVRCEIGEVHIEGVTAFDLADLVGLIKPPGGGWFDSTPWFVLSNAESGVNSITALYLSRGYLLVQVDGPEILIRDEGTYADLDYWIDEGVLFRVAELSFEGELALPESELTEAIPTAVGEPYAPQLDRKIQAALIEHYGNAGYPDASARVVRRADDESGEVTINLRVQPGVRATISEIRVEGNQRTSESLIRSRMDFEVGEPFTPTRQRTTFRQLFTTGLFSNINLEFEGDADQTERPLTVRVEENPTSEIFIEPGWGSYELARIKAGYRNQNLFGTGRSFRAEGIGSVRHAELELGISDSFLFGTDVFADLSGTVLRREETSFTRESAGIDATVARRISRQYETRFAYEYRRSAAKDVDVSDPATLAALDDLSISALELSLRFDSRDNPFAPRRGNSARLSLQWGDQVLGSELDFLRARAQFTHFIPIRSSSSIGLAFRTGAIIPTHDTAEIPIQERFFNGGERTVRSFRENELGPLDVNGEALGGETFSVLTAELRQRLAGNLSGALFVDFGNVAANYEDYLSFNDVRTAIGAGIRYMLPIGPLRVDGGWNPNPRTGEDSFVLHLSVGMPF